MVLAGTSAAGAEEWDELWGTDSFADLELKGVWERTGKGKKRWAPGDTTGDAAVDASLLYSTWVMNRPDLYVKEDCPNCGAVRFVLGHLKFPFDLKFESTADVLANARAMAKFTELDADGNGFLEGAELEKLAEWLWATFLPDPGAPVRRAVRTPHRARRGITLLRARARSSTPTRPRRWWRRSGSGTAASR